MEPVNFSAIVIKSALQMESVAYEKDILLESNIEEDLMIQGSEDHLRRITTSLIENAIKYEPAGRKIHVVLAKRRKQLILSIQNQDSFINAEDLPHVFERFYRGDKSRRTQDSHGLGLAITKQLVENLGGKIHVESSEKQGTIFTVTFS